MKKIAADKNYIILKEAKTIALFPEGKERLVNVIKSGIKKKEKELAAFLEEPQSVMDKSWRERLSSILRDIKSYEIELEAAEGDLAAHERGEDFEPSDDWKSLKENNQWRL